MSTISSNFILDNLNLPPPSINLRISQWKSDTFSQIDISDEIHDVTIILMKLTFSGLPLLAAGEDFLSGEDLFSVTLVFLRT